MCKKSIHLLKRLLSVVLVAAMLCTSISWNGIISTVAAESNSNGTEPVPSSAPDAQQSDNSTPAFIDPENKSKEKFADDRVIVRVAGNTAIRPASANNFYGIEIENAKELMKVPQTKSPMSKSGADTVNDSMKVITLKHKGEQAVKEAVAQLNRTEGIVYAEPDYMVQVSSVTPNDTFFDSPNMWGMKKIHAPEAWETETGSEEVVVAVIDTGIDYRHPDLADNIWRNPGEIENDGIDNDKNGFIDDIHGWGQSNNKIYDEYGHGTHVAGTIAAAGNNNTGTAGVSWNVKLMVLKIFDNYGSGFTSDIVQAIKYAGMMNARVLNGSYGGYTYSQAEKDAIDSIDSLFAVAACNDSTNNDETPPYPASYDCANIITVAATDRDDSLSSFSNYGANSVDIAAPGEDIFSTAPLESYNVFSGTSMATPHVAGAAALILSHEPSLTTAMLKERLLSGADVIPQLDGKVTGSKRLNIYKALNPGANDLPEYIPEALPEQPEFTGFAGGDGTVADPYQISTPLQLNEVRNYPNSHFIQINDIDMTYDTQNPDGLFYNESRGFVPIRTFRGVYDGDGHVIKGLTIRDSSWYIITAFIIYNYGWIMNLGLEDGHIGGWQVANMAGYNFGVMANCYNTNSTTSYGCYAAGLVLGNNRGEMINCYNTGKVTSFAESYSAAGGLTCWNTDSYTMNCYNTGDVNVPYIEDPLDMRLGGIAAYDYYTIKNCYTTGKITTFLGTGYGPVSGVEATKDTVIENSYCLGIFGGASGRGTGTILNQDKMQQTANYVNWDFGRIWDISSDRNSGYPYLRSNAPLDGLKGIDEFSGGDGSPKNPLQVSTPTQLDKVRKYLNKFFIQVRDIDLTYDTQDENGLFYHGGKGWLPIGASTDGTSDEQAFQTIYYGNGYTINGLNANRTDLANVGLFSSVSGTVKDVATINSYIRGGQYTGSIAGRLTGIINGCYNAGYVASETSGQSAYAGGIAGYMANTYAVISNCYNVGTVYGLTEDRGFLGGITGAQNTGSIINCYNTGVISGESEKGSTSIYTEEIAGYAYELVESTYRLGIYGNKNGKGTILTSDQMKDQTSFIGWDFDNIWLISPHTNNGYPALRAFSPIVISNNPSDETAKIGVPITLNVEATVQRGTLSYQWYENSVQSNTGGTLIKDANSASYTPPADTLGTKYYYCVVSVSESGYQSKATASLAVAVLTSIDGLRNASVPVMIQNPSDQTVNMGSAAILRVEARVSAGTLSYQWYENTTATNIGGTKIEGAAQNSYSPSTSSAGTRYYYCVITNTDDSATGVKTAVTTSNSASVITRTVTNAPTPVVTKISNSQTVNVGERVTISVEAQASQGSISYQWSAPDNGGRIDGATSPTYTPDTSTIGTIKYYCIITNTDNTATGNKKATATTPLISITVNNLTNAAIPVITKEPVNQTVNLNEAATLSIAAEAANGTLSYQWYKNSKASSTSGSTALRDGKQTTYAPDTSTEGTMYYYCVITNTYESATGNKTSSVVSNVVSCHVKRNVPTTNASEPIITKEPSNQTVTIGQNAALNVEAQVSQGSISYQWIEVRNDSEPNEKTIDGATSASYKADTDAIGTRYYYCIMTNTDNSATGDKTASVSSKLVSVTVNDLTNAAVPLITKEPSNQTVIIGKNATLNVEAQVSQGSISYQWIEVRNDLEPNEKTIDGATSASYKADTDAIGTRYYYCIMTNTDNSATGNKTASVSSTLVSVTVNDLTNAAAPIITKEPSDQTVTIGQNAALNVEAQVSQGSISYQWIEVRNDLEPNEKTIDGATSASYKADTDAIGTRYYYCIMTNTDNSATGNKTAFVSSKLVSVTVNDLTNAATPIITKEPSDQTVTIGQNAALNVEAQVSQGSISYQWFEVRNDSEPNEKTIDGATSASYKADTNAIGTKYYYCIITNTDNSATGNKTASVSSKLVSVTVNDLTNAAVPLITKEPSNQTVTIGQNAALNVEAQVSQGSISYQWIEVKNDSEPNENRIDGATSASYKADTNAIDTRYYYCIMTNTDNSATGDKTASVSSKLVSVTVNDLTNATVPLITKEPFNQTVTIGQNATLNVEAQVSQGSISFQWYECDTYTNSNGKIINGATNVSYTPSTTTDGIKYYYCVVTNTDSTATGSKTATAVSRAVSVTVQREAVIFPVVLVKNPTSQTVTLGGNATLHVEAYVSEGAISYQWYDNTMETNVGGILIPGATSASYTPKTDELGTKYYYCVLTNGENLTANNAISSVPSNAVTVTVKPVTYKVTYHKNGATSGNVPVNHTQYESGSLFTISDNTGKLARTGYVFDGWTISQNGSGAVYKRGSLFLVGNSDITLYAKWTAVTYKVTFNKNGLTKGRVPVDTIKYKKGSTVTVKGNTGKLTRKGYVLAGWTSTKNGTGRIYKTGSRFTISRNVTLYAKWIRNSAKFTTAGKIVRRGGSMRLIVTGNNTIRSVKWAISNSRIASIRSGGTAKRIGVIYGKARYKKVTLAARVNFKDGTYQTIKRIIYVR